MKKHAFQKSILMLLAVVLIPLLVQAAFVRNLPLTLVQPDSRAISVFITGDEFHRWAHDRNGYAITRDPVSGFYVYAVRSGEKIAASEYRVGSWDPRALGLERNLGPALAKQTPIRLPAVSSGPERVQGMVEAPFTGTLNNIVIFVRFSDDSEFGDPISTYDSVFNASGPTSNSLGEYFYEASYNQLSISSSFYPPASGGAVVSYQDPNLRGYFRPYDAVSNPIGYHDQTEGDSREKDLLRAAVNAVSSQVPSNLDLDADSDGEVDGVCFIIRGAPDTGCGSPLWPHTCAIRVAPWVYLNGIKVNRYNVQIQDYMKLSGGGVGVLCHEMFHILGAPDLFRGIDISINPVAFWDIMAGPWEPPQHMGAYMKYKYGHWLASLPVITTPGEYSLNPLASSTGNCYRVRSPASTTEFFVLEYRKRVGLFEGTLAREGLLVYRINSMGVGDYSPPDEVYIYRPGGTLTVDGDPYDAGLSQDNGRTALDDSTDPSCFLSDGTEGKLKIFGVGSMGDTISFSVDWSHTPVLTTAVVKNIMETTADSGGNITKDFGRAVKDRGICWSEAARPTIADSHTHNGTGTGTFASHLTNLAPGATYHIRAYATNSEGTAYGNEVTFMNPALASSVTSPATGALWTRGTTQAIHWEKGASTDISVKIKLYRGSTKVQVVRGSAANVGSFNWTIPVTTTPGTDYRIEVRTLDGMYMALSGYFTIAKPTLTIAAPTTGTVWTRGTTQMITWVATGTQNANVKIQLFRGTTNVLDIALTAPNSGGYSWPIPASLPVGTNYKVKIKTVDGVVTATSPVFTLN